MSRTCSAPGPYAVRCTRELGHPGPHEHVSDDGAGASLVRWSTW